MVDQLDTVCDWNVYKAPSDAILLNRRAFYGLQRKRREPIEQWWKRVQSCIRCCEFPTVIEFFLIDRFVCGFYNSELKTIRTVHSWTLERIMETFLTQNIEPEPIEQNSADNEYIISNQIMSLDLIKSEPVCAYIPLIVPKT